MTYLELIRDSWSRDFNYTDYVLHADAVMCKTQSTIRIVSEAAYKLICDGLTLDMEQCIGVEQVGYDASIDQSFEIPL